MGSYDKYDAKIRQQPAAHHWLTAMGRTLPDGQVIDSRIEHAWVQRKVEELERRLHSDPEFAALFGDPSASVRREWIRSTAAGFARTKLEQGLTRREQQAIRRRCIIELARHYMRNASSEDLATLEAAATDLLIERRAEAIRQRRTALGDELAERRELRRAAERVVVADVRRELYGDVLQEVLAHLRRGLIATEQPPSSDPTDL